MKVTKASATHFDEFFEETCEITTENYDITTAELNNLYRRWCKENGIKEVSDRRLSNWFADNAETKGAQRCEQIKRNGKRLRGYKCVKIRGEWKNITII